MIPMFKNDIKVKNIKNKMEETVLNIYKKNILL